MVEKNIKVCDLCENNIAKTNCGICGKDVCNYCSEEFPFLIENIRICSKCQKSVLKGDFWTKEFKEEILKQIKEYGIKRRTLEELEKKDEEKEFPFPSTKTSSHPLFPTSNKERRYGLYRYRKNKSRII